MSLLLDSHVVLWSLLDPAKLSVAARSRIADRSEQVFLSAVTAYEIEYKQLRDARMPKLPASLAELATPFDFDWLAINEEDAALAARLPGPHRDPWDRMIAAQARRRDLELITADSAIHAVAPSWGLKVLW